MQHELTGSSGGFHTLGRWTAERAALYPDKTAIDDRGVTLSYGDLERRASALARNFLRGGYSIGDRIATLSGNSADQIVLFFACAKVGLVFTPLSWRLSPREISYQIDEAQPALLIVEDEHTSLAEEALKLATFPPLRTDIAALGAGGEIPRSRDAANQISRSVSDHDPLLLIYTSGSEGSPKGALLSHSNCFWNNLSLSKIISLTSDDVVLAILPQFHVGAWNIQPLLAWWVGATVVLERNFDAGRILQLIPERGVTSMMAVPTNYLLLAEHPNFADTDFSSLQHVQVGGASMPEPLLHTWHSKGVRLTQGYGLTENSPNTLCLSSDEAVARVGWAGKPYPYVEVQLVDPTSGELVEGAGVGELMVRGPGVFLGYYKNPEATGKVLRNGWLSTGDLVERCAEGYYRVVDRIKDIYISGGENVSPSEIEKVLLQHPDVAEAAVIGTPDHRWGEVGAALVVPVAGALPNTESILNHCRQQLASFKVPKVVLFVPELPKTGLSKLSRGKLREQYSRQIAEAGVR